MTDNNEYDEDARADYLKGSMVIELKNRPYDGYDYVIENIEVGDNNGSLFAHFDIVEICPDGGMRFSKAGEWIDLDDGLLINDEEESDFYGCSTSFNIEDIWRHVNNWLRDNPIPEETLEKYRATKAECEEEQQTSYSM